MQFLFPADYFEKHLPDALLRDQAAALAAAGHSIHRIPSGELQPTSRILPAPTTEPLIYRGFMLEPEEYSILEQAVSHAGARLLTPLEMYLGCHYLPRWYSLIPEWTPETVFFDDIPATLAGLADLDWPGYFLKDHVKSLKTGPGAIANSIAEAEVILTEMQKYRGRIEGGICVRKVESFLPETEQRFFVYQHQAFAPLAGQALPEAVLACQERIPSLFFSVDVIQTREGQQRIVEIGDGQVSDPTGWSCERFADIFS